MLVLDERSFMEITQTSVRGAGTLHDVLTRGGQRFRIFVKNTGERETYVYPETDDGEVITFELDADEADAIANILHSRPVPARLRDLERRVDALEDRGEDD
jgi:TrkA domain protein